MIEIIEEIGALIFGNKRLTALKHFARQKDFIFKGRTMAENFPLEVQKFDVFQNKKRRTVKGLMYRKVRKNDIYSQIFDLSAYSDFGKRTTTVFLFHSDKLEMPSTKIQPRPTIGKIGSIFSASEWGKLDPKFDRNFSVASTNMNRLRLLVTSEFTEALYAISDFTMEARGQYMVLYKKYSEVDIIDMDDVFDVGLELLDIVLHDYSQEL